MATLCAPQLMRILFLLPLMDSLPARADEVEPIVRFASAVEKGDLKTVNEMLAGGLDPNTEVPGSPLGFTPLFLAVRANQTAVTEALLKAGADPKVEDDNGDPVMVFASDKGCEDQARILIHHGISIDSRNSRGITALLRGAPYEESEDVQAKLDLGANPDLADNEGNTPLMNAAASGNLAAIEVLIKAGAKPNLVNKSGKTALLLAVSSDASIEEKEIPDVVKLLIKGGADPNLRDAGNNTALITAITSYRSTPELIQAVLDAKPDVALRDNEGQDALFHAVLRTRGQPIIERLLALGADLKTSNSDGTDLLMLAAAGNDPAQVRFFMEHGLSPDRKSKSGATAVHGAVRAGRWVSEEPRIDSIEKRTLEILKFLREHGASLTVADAEGDTPLHLAAMTGLANVTAYLLPFYKDPKPVNLKGETPLHLAASSSGEVVDQFLPKYPDPDLRDQEGRTALMNAAAVGYQYSLESLVKAGAHVDALNRAGISALSEAVTANDSERVRMLIECGARPETLLHADSDLLRVARLFHEQMVKAEDYTYFVGFLAGCAKDINFRDSSGMTVLMWVACTDNIAALDAVLKHKPDLRAKSPDGRTALMWAACSLAGKSMKALKEAGADASLRDATGRTADERLAWSNGKATGAAPIKGEDSILLESLTTAREAALQDYLKLERWSADDRILGSPPLHLAAALDKVDATQELLKRGAPTDQLSNDSSTPLMVAATNGNTETVRFLLAHGANASLRDANRQRAVDLAVHMRQIESARLLIPERNSFSSDESGLLAALVGLGDGTLLRDFLKAGASIPPPDKRSSDTDPFGRTQPSPEAPLVAAAMSKDAGMLKTLAGFPTASGADDSSLVAIALHAAAENGRLSNVRFLVEDQKADPNTLLEDSFGGVTRISSDEGKGVKPQNAFSALSRALESGHVEVVRYLIEHGAAIVGRTRGGQPPLTYVIQHRQPELLELFLKNKAPTDLVDFDGLTALHLAAAADDETATRLLLEHGANPKAKDSKGKTPLDMARNHGAKKTVSLLKSVR